MPLQATMITTATTVIDGSKGSKVDFRRRITITFQAAGTHCQAENSQETGSQPELCLESHFILD